MEDKKKKWTGVLSVNKEHTVILIGDNHARRFAEKLASNLENSYELTGM